MPWASWPFAGSAFLVCPITLDYGAFHESLGAIDTNTIPRGGTNISSAIHEAQVALRRRPGSDRILICHRRRGPRGSALAAAQAAAQEDGLKIYTVGVGSASGDLIPIPPEQGGGFVKDDTGAFVKSRLDETALKAIATATGGLYVPLGTQGEGLDTIFKTVLGPLAKHDLASRQQRIYIERYQWPLAASLLALLASLLIGTRRRGSARKPRNPRSTVALSLLLLIDLAAHAPRTAAAGAGAESGGSPTAAATQVSRLPAPRAQHRAARPQGAGCSSSTRHRRVSSGPVSAGGAGVPAIDQSCPVERSATPGRSRGRLLQPRQHAVSRRPENRRLGAPDTIQQWTDAVKAYETALQLRADDADSKFNRDLVKRKIDALKQKQNQQNKNQNQGQGQGQGNGQGQGKGQGQGQNQQQNGQPPKDNHRKGSRRKANRPRVSHRRVSHRKISSRRGSRRTQK